jgi:hypothetical protein
MCLLEKLQNLLKQFVFSAIFQSEFITYDFRLPVPRIALLRKIVFKTCSRRFEKNESSCGACVACVWLLSVCTEYEYTYQERTMYGLVRVPRVRVAFRIDTNLQDRHESMENNRDIAV